MESMRFTNSCVPIATFKAQAKKQLADLHKGSRVLIVTQKGEAAAVMMSPQTFDAFRRLAFLHAVDEGLTASAAGKVVPHEEVVAKHRARLAARRTIAAKRTRAK
jgi:predicted transcriptional regulator